ncbi:MAG TPA: hypothetical protein PLL53_01340, partial [Saprospiraceae bacterium]|nr:hypothetical protein [Saprospiraceae bacterium]
MLSAVSLLLACCLPRTAHAQGACGEWAQTAIGAPSSGSAQFDACAPGTITITSAGIGSSSADIQYMVQRELCGDGTFDVKIESISNGRAGLEIRADNAPGAVKAGVKTPLSNTLTRYLRNAPGTAQSASSINAMGHRWLRLVRSGSNIQLFWSPNGTNWTSAALYTNIALPACARIGIFVESNNAAVATGVFNSLSGFTSPGNAPATSFSFAAGSLNAEAGQSAQVCVNIANPCACAPASVQVALQGNAAPHLSGFSTQTLQFQSGDTQKCFSLATAAAPGDGSYTLILQNPTGGNAAAIGAQASVSVAVTGEPVTPTGCPWAGPDREICRGESVLIGCPSGGANPSNYCFRWVPEEGLETPHQEYSYASPSKTTTYTLYVTDDQGNLIASDEVTVTIKNAYTAVITPEEPEICPGESVMLEVVVDGNSQNVTYLWETGETTPSISVRPEYSYHHSVQISDELSGCNETIRQIVFVHNVDMIRPIIEPSVICELPAPPGLAPRFPNDVSQAKSEGDCSRNYSWLYVGPLSDGVSISWSTGETGTDNIRVYEAGQHSVSITYPNSGCTVVVPMEVTSCVEVVVEPTYSANGEQVLDAGEGYLSYLWHDGSTGQTIPLGGAGTYAVTVVNENGCVGKWETAIEDFTDINDVYMVLWASPPNTLDRHLYIWGEGANNSSLDRKAIEAIVAKQTAPVNGGVDKIFWTPTPMHNDFEQIDRMMNRDQLRIYPIVIENGEAKSHFLNTDLNVYETYKFQLNLPGQVYDLDRANGRYFDITSFSGLPDMTSAQISVKAPNPSNTYTPATSMTITFKNPT